MNLKMIIFVILCIVAGLVMTSIGYTVVTWQYWVVLLCACGSYSCGRLQDRR